jgi:hypothetical protein
MRQCCLWRLSITTSDINLEKHCYTRCVAFSFFIVKRNKKPHVLGGVSAAKLLILLTFTDYAPCEPNIPRGSENPNEYRSRAL